MSDQRAMPRYSGTAFEARAQFIQRRPLRHVTNLIEEEIGERHAGKRGTRLEPAMEVAGHVADLDHDGHVDYMRTCAAHVKLDLSLPEFRNLRERRRPMAAMARALSSQVDEWVRLARRTAAMPGGMAAHSS